MQPSGRSLGYVNIRTGLWRTVIIIAERKKGKWETARRARPPSSLQPKGRCLLNTDANKARGVSRFPASVRQEVLSPLGAWGHLFYGVGRSDAWRRQSPAGKFPRRLSSRRILKGGALRFSV